MNQQNDMFQNDPEHAPKGGFAFDSEFAKHAKALESRRCKICHGTGKIDDAEPGDTYYREFKCNACKGTGIAPCLRHTMGSGPCTCLLIEI